MGKKILVQRRGKGSPVFRSLGHKRKGKARYLPLGTEEETGKVQMEVVDLFHESGRGAPLMKLKYQDGRTNILPAIESVSVGQILEQGSNADTSIPGNILPLSKMPEGSWICNVESRPNDGGSIGRASGNHVTVLSQNFEAGTTNVQLSSKRIKTLNNRCRASIGVIAGGGRTDRPFLKAGKKRALKRAKGHKYPRVRGVAMNIVSHPHGGGAHQSPGSPTTVSRHASPGRKVGLIAASRTGRKRGRQSRRTLKD